MEPIADPLYWKRRLADSFAHGERHQAIFKCTLSRWQAIEAKHREILAATIQPEDSILDAGCAWGRLLTLMPESWRGEYFGIDISPDMIALARLENPGHRFIVGDLRKIDAVSQRFDLAILISIRPMVRRNLGDAVWYEMETELRRVARRLLYLECDPDDGGSIE